MKRAVVIAFGAFVTYLSFLNYSVISSGEQLEITTVPVVMAKEVDLEVEEPATEIEVEIVIEETPQDEYLGEFRITAYCSCEKCCDSWSLNRPKDEHGNEIVIGASGKELISGYSVAVDPKVIPYGTILIIDGKEYIAADCGGAIKGNRIDLYHDSHQDALEWGIRYKEVYLKNRGEEK